MSLLLSYYKNLLINTSCGNYHGVVIKAKPLFILTLIESIGEGLWLGNALRFIPASVEGLYANLCQKYDPTRIPTRIGMPFFHLNKEPYYNLKFKDGVVAPKQAESPSSRFLRDNIDYAYLDPGLWDLLQDPKAREELKEAVINHFFSTK